MLRDGVLFGYCYLSESIASHAVNVLICIKKHLHGIRCLYNISSASSGLNNYVNLGCNHIR